MASQWLDNLHTYMKNKYPEGLTWRTDTQKVLHEEQIPKGPEVGNRYPKGSKSETETQRARSRKQTPKGSYMETHPKVPWSERIEEKVHKVEFEVRVPKRAAEVQK